MGTRCVVDNRPRSGRPALCQDLDLSAGAHSRVPRRQPFPDVCPRHRPSGPRLGQRRTGLDSRRRPRLELSARRDRRARRTPRGLRVSGLAPRRSTQRHGVLQPRHPRPRRGLAVDADDGRQPDWHVHRSVPRARRTRPLLHAVARHVPGRRVRRRRQTRQSSVASSPRIHRGRARVAAVSGSRPPRRSGGHSGGGGRGVGREGAHLLRESIPAQGRNAALADVDRRPGPGTAGHLCRRSRHHRTEGGRRDHDRARQGAGGRESGARRRPRKPRVRSWPT